MTEESIARDLLAALEVVVLEREADRTLKLAGSAPGWFFRFRPSAASTRQDVRKALESPFLENFLTDAESFWESEGAGRIRSGMWTEAGAMGADFHLEASAVSVGSRKFLLIENQTDGYEEKQAMLQRVRSNNLRRRESRRAEEQKPR
jgi:hypothetical protein